MGNALVRMAFILGTIFTISLASAEAAPKKVKKSARSSQVGEALRRKKTLTFEGRTVESLRGGNYDSVSHLDDGGANGSKRLYSLPSDFSNRVADQGNEMRYRQ